VFDGVGPEHVETCKIDQGRLHVVSLQWKLTCGDSTASRVPGETLPLIGRMVCDAAHGWNLYGYPVCLAAVIPIA
jgi:hypothetical protein